MIRGDLSVRALAEFVCRQGDLYPVREGRQVEPEEGLLRQQDAQRRRCAADPGYAKEVAVEAAFVCGGEQRRVKGRMDGLLVEPDGIVIEEFKCRGALPAAADVVDRAQAWLYAGLYAQQLTQETAMQVRVTYIEADTTEERVFTQDTNSADAIRTLAFIVHCYTVRIEAHLERARARLAWAADVAFPLPSFRQSQQAIARRVYQALIIRENLLLEAPTGSGKTLAVLYPALKAQARDDQLFFLTSRNAGARAALGAARQLDAQTSQLCVVELTAKEKTCFVPGMPCDASLCPYAAGYFDRAACAVDEVLERKLADRSVIEEVATKHTVCPFELSLDAALWADLIVGDYNYVFDPVVRLQRFANHDRLHLLVDEAHQLSPRVRDMLAVEIDRGMVREAKRVSLPGIKKRVASIDRALMAMRRAHGQGEHVVESVDALVRACGRLLDAVAEQEVELARHGELEALYFAAHRWRRSQQWYQSDQFAHHIHVQGRDIKLRRACLDPATYIQALCAEHGAVIRFSGTVSPLPLYQRLHGAAKAVGERAQSPFQSEQALVLVVRDVPTYYNTRSASLENLISLIENTTRARSGRYMVAFPSYAYLQDAAAAYPAGGQELFVQARGQTNEETQALLDEFSAAPAAVMFVVMGGSYGESIDFGDTRLSGVIMVGIGLPPPSLERNLVEAYFDAQEGAGWGRMVAYTQPALVKSIQAAGRLIRSPDDFGVICLVDPRYTAPEVRRFFPSHWQPRVTAAADVPQVVEAFWHEQPA